MSQKFNTLTDTPLDPIMQAAAAWATMSAADPNAVNTTIGVLLDPESDRPWQPMAVQAMREESLGLTLDVGEFGYQGQLGHKRFLEGFGKLLLGDTEFEAASPDLVAVQALGGTGALSLANEVLSELLVHDDRPSPAMVIDPGWPNHRAIFGDRFHLYDYHHLNEAGAYDHQAALKAIADAPNNAVILLQTCGYNDDGVDRSFDQWNELLKVIADNGQVAMFDTAYFGLADGPDLDGYALKQSVHKGILTCIAASASKNMGLYNERVGALYIANAEQQLGKDQRDRLQQLCARVVRRTYSSPPLVGVAAAAEVLQRPDALSQYLEELQAVRKHLRANRQYLARFLNSRYPQVAKGKGLFTRLSADGFSPEQQNKLSQAGILTLPNSRINIAGIRKEQIERVGKVLMSVTN